MLRLLPLLFLFSCQKENRTTPPPSIIINDTTVVIPAKKDTVYTYLALGDSYTIGQSVPTTDRYPVQTAQLLLNDSLHFSSPEIIAQTGWTTGDLLQRINNTPPSKPLYDIVTLLIGVNNQYRGLSKDEYADQFTILLNDAIHFANNKNTRVIVLSIPDYSVTPFANGYDKSKIAKEIDDFNVINKQITLAAGVTYLDITPSTRMAATDPSLVAGDGLHPSGKEYAKWTTWLVPLIKESLKK